MSVPRKTAIVTGASQGIGAGLVKAFVERGFNVVANSRKVTQSTEVADSDRVALVDGHIGEPTTAAKIVETALSRFQSIDALVNNAGIFFTKPFTDYTVDEWLGKEDARVIDECVDGLEARERRLDDLGRSRGLTNMAVHQSDAIGVRDLG